MHSVKKEYANYFSLNKKNITLIENVTKLKNEILDLNEKNEILQSIIKEKKINNTLLDSLEKRYEYIHARVEKNNWALQKNIILLNKGKSNGIKKGMPVSNDNGAIGVVSTVNNKFCEVTTILNLKTNLYAVIKKNNLVLGEGFLTWDGYSNKYAQLEIGIDIRVNIGDSIFTSKGIYIGKINQINSKTTSNGQKIKVSLGVNFKNIQEVYILKDKLQDKLIELEN
jgi:rod shape-determining protein MreC